MSKSRIPKPKPNSDESILENVRRITRMPDATPAELADHLDARLQRLWERHGKTENDVKRAFVATAYAEVSNLRDRLRAMTNPANQQP